MKKPIFHKLDCIVGFKHRFYFLECGGRITKTSYFCSHWLPVTCKRCLVKRNKK